MLLAFPISKLNSRGSTSHKILQFLYAIKTWLLNTQNLFSISLFSFLQHGFLSLCVYWRVACATLLLLLIHHFTHTNMRQGLFSRISKLLLIRHRNSKHDTTKKAGDWQQLSPESPPLPVLDPPSPSSNATTSLSTSTKVCNIFKAITFSSTQSFFSTIIHVTHIDTTYMPTHSHPSNLSQNKRTEHYLLFNSMILL